MLLADKLSSFKKRVVRKHYPFFIFPLFIFPFYPVAADALRHDINEVKVMAESGAVSLALQSVDEQQLVFDENNFTAWLEWERERLKIYTLGQRWKATVQRVDMYEYDLPDEYKLPDEFYFWAKTKQVDALLALKKAQHARQILLSLIWPKKDVVSQDISIKKQWLAKWQKRIIESYLISGDKEDALLAAQRYYQDYDSKQLEDRLLYARILLINQREDEAVELLKNDTQHPQGGMLHLLAQLRSKEKPAEQVLKSAMQQMRSKNTNGQLKFLLRAVVAEAAKKNIDRPALANALEHVLAGYKKTELPLGLFDFSADTLWDAYIEYARYLGNRQQFLIGDDKQWLKAALKAQKKHKVKARSLYALVIIKGQSDKARLQAAKGFLNLMHKRKRGAQLIKKLFLKSKYFKNISEIPSVIRYDLINIALSRSNIELASDLMTTIKVAPAGIDDFQWQLQRARIFVLGGKAKEGVDALVVLLDKYKTLTENQLNRLLQVLFDLQTIKQHEFAYFLFDMIAKKDNAEKSQREIYFWMAESLKSLQKYTEAAKLYLRSATYNNSKGFDPWGQTARYQAAEMLTKATLLQDAHALYEGLLAVTKDPTRRAVLKSELQKLWLVKEPDEADFVTEE